jgi:DNA-binding NtrC family response regulator
VLVAEDEPSLRRLLGRLLDEAGYEVVATRDGDEALSAFAAHRERIAAAVLDAAILPRGAAEVVDGIASVRPDVGFVLVSGAALADDLRARLKTHRGVFLQKPFARRALLRALEDAMAPRST